jgi:hypothetical protein
MLPSIGEIRANPVLALPVLTIIEGTGDAREPLAQLVAVILDVLNSSGQLGGNVSFDDGTNAIALSMNVNGDLVVSQSAGPNAGKSVNLTYGLWA